MTTITQPSAQSTQQLEALKQNHVHAQPDARPYHSDERT